VVGGPPRRGVACCGVVWRRLRNRRAEIAGADCSKAHFSVLFWRETHRSNRPPLDEWLERRRPQATLGSWQIEPFVLLCFEQLEAREAAIRESLLAAAPEALEALEGRISQALSDQLDRQPGIFRVRPGPVRTVGGVRDAGQRAYGFEIVEQ
jgi:hypothetical protein